MQRNILSIFLIIISQFSIAQTSGEIEKLITETNKYIDLFNGISRPIDRYISVNETNLPQEMLDAIKVDPNWADILSENGDSIDDVNLQGLYEEIIIANVDEIMSYYEIDKAKEFVSQLGQINMQLTKSPDYKLLNFTFDANTGGTYRSRVSLVYFTEFIIDTVNDNLEDPYRIFESDGYSEIDTIHSINGVKYILLGDVQGCSSCWRSYISLVSFKNGNFEQNFSYSVNSRNWETSIEYDSKAKIIHVDYLTDDLTRDCNCENLVDRDYYPDHSEEEEISNKICSCTFTFKESNFYLTKECWEEAKD